MLLKIANWFIPRPAKAGFKKAQGFLDGKKTHVIGLALVLQGVAIIMGDIGNMGELIDIIPYIKEIATSAGFEKIMQGFAAMTIRVAISKSK